MQEEKAKPFLKWVGGKRSILPTLLKTLPKNYSTYNEIFLGGGALFFALQPKTAYLADTNPHLITSYLAVRDHLDKVLETLTTLKDNHSRAQYLEVRECITYEKDPAITGAYFIYLNKTCFNGLWRVNKAGKFNVPMGAYKNPNILDIPVLQAASKALQNAEIRNVGFYGTKPKRDAFYYLDPPYHKTFSKYAAHEFNEDNHKDLLRLCQEIDKVGAHFLLSNSSTEFTRELYKDFIVEDVLAGRFVSSKGSQRKKEIEILVRNY